MHRTFALLLFFLIASAAPAFAQTAADPRVDASKIPADSAAATAATEQLASKYDLDPVQKTQMQAVQQRKYDALTEFESFKTTDPALYRRKMKSLQSGTLASIRNLMRTREQIALYRKTQSDIRKQRSAKQEELATQKASKEMLEEALLQIYAE
jgi:hypothetical protein